ncbi:calcium-translocating P-type ATPase, PMCA-type [[Clostridium] fimetarium]|uniref:Plasma-membrane calcium-translocating P-type ATPase n=1 Tax=[Clostridium] fimetarium TaxID=99656 RepID=A0A1I0QKK2_9FIRM|nr:calcium-translocating P-type ATPase, PMCA-type [[Clostridium] fimetarium]SEW27673.1 plasma-membrane calcium-translocating P-type ATPase [[Clostridium] fimetarium]
MLNPENVLPDSFVGLTIDEISKSKDRYGDNQLGKRKRNTFLRQFLQSFNDPIIKILLIVLAVNVLFLIRNFDWYETAGIAVAIFLATFISTLSEYGSESAFEKLQEEADKTKCRVKRAEGLLELPINDIVVGDYIILQAGERIPGDGIIVFGELNVDQSALNGESKETLKIPSKTSSLDDDGSNFMQKNKLFRGSIVCTGEGVMLVTQVGNNTFYGHIAYEIQEETRESPLKLRLGKLAETISSFGYLGAGTVAIADLFNSIFMSQGFDMVKVMEILKSPPIILGNLLHAITLAITVIVVAVPEGLPMMITVVLSSNMKSMLKDNVLVRKLVGIETSGSLNILFTDKTGTITKGKLQVISFLSGDCTQYSTISELIKNQGLYDLFKLSAVYNTSSSVSSNDDKTQAIGGNTTERAILDFGGAHFLEKRKVKVLSRIPFNSTDKYSTADIMNNNKHITLIKGAPEKILLNCSSYYDKYGATKSITHMDDLTKIMSDMSGKAIRLLAVATSDFPVKKASDLKNLTLVGIIGIRDEVRQEAHGAIRKVMDAGVQVVMITGDNKETASAIAREVGLIKDGQQNAVITSSELTMLRDNKLKQILPQLRVVARALPSDKSRLIKISQEMGLVSGMTGDGVNDAPALKKADVGFSMGSGAEIAKEASDIVILDDNFLSISKAILYGRTIFKSIRKFLIFQLTVNLCAVVVSIIGPFIGVPTPITVLQMLWINMVMDTLAGLAFSGEIPLDEYMKEPPKRRDEPIINLYMWNQILFTGIYTASLCILFLKLPIFSQMFRGSEGRQFLMTAFFGLFIFASIFNSFNARTYRLNLFAHIWKNKSFMFIIFFIFIVQLLLIYFGGTLFRTTGLNLLELQVVFLLAFTVIPIDMARKVFIRMNGRKGSI